MSRMFLGASVIVISISLCHRSEAGEPAKAVPHPLSAKDRDAIRKTFETTVARMTGNIAADPKKVGFYFQRGDALFFLGRFKEAVADYEKIVELDPSRDKSHWRRGIAYFYAKQYKKAAHQFEIYDSFDMVDRENGIWRFFSQGRAYGIKKARKGLLKYKKDDREPFPDVYRLFSEDITGEAILKKIAAAKIDDDDREKRLFYAHLYIGLNHALHDRKKPAIKHLRKAVANKWGRKADGGPHHMWQVGRLHYELLTAKKKSAKTKKENGSR